jgi:Fe2+ transport system protein FeoA
LVFDGPSFINADVKLSEIPVGANAKFSSLDNFPVLRTKLNQYGLYQGDSLLVVRVAPLGGPLLIEVNGREIALGREIAEKILVELE